VCNSKIEKNKNTRPNKENRTWNSEYMHTGDRSFGLPLEETWTFCETKAKTFVDN
jgi:hypothetical protein